MRTEPAPAALFLFAHQDDEFGVFHRIEVERAQGRRVICAYLTDGASPNVAASIRNAESLSVLEDLGVRREDVHFIGERLGIPDGGLADRIEAGAAWLSDFLGDHAVDALYLPAWEGGHPDHDVLHAIGTRAALAHGLQGRCRQFSLYNGCGLPSVLFRVLSPLPANGAVTRETIPVLRRMHYLRLCLRYRSQFTSWLGLLPFVLIHYLLDGTQALQPVNPTRIGGKPHEGELYYEARGFASWPAVAERLGCRR